MIGNRVYKRIIALILAAVAALSLSACSKGEEELPNSEYLTPAVKVPPLVVYAFMRQDELLKLPFMYKRYKSYKWVKNITK